MTPLSPKARRILKYLVRTLLVIALGLGVRLAVGHYRQTIRPGHDTTRITTPVRADGTIDYVAAINAQTAVPPAENAAVLAREAVGTNFASPAGHAAMEKDWGFPPLGAATPRLVTFESFQKARKAPGDDEAWDAAATAARQRPWRAADHPDVAAWLADNAAALDAWHAVARRPRWFVPRTLSDPDDCLFEALLPSVGSLRGAANALLARAALRRGEGDVAGCRADLLAAHRLGRLMFQAPSMIEFLVGLAITAAAADLDAACAAGLSEADARAMLAERDALPAIPDLAPLYDRHLRYEALSLITQIRRFGTDALGKTYERDAHGREVPVPRRPAGLFAFGLVPPHFDAHLRSANAWADRVVAAGALPTFRDRQAALAGVQRDLAAAKAAVGGGVTGAMEKVVLAAFPSEPGRGFELRDRAVMQQDLSRVALALAAHKGRTGRYPAALSALVPADLPAVPLDLFTGGPLVYRLVGEGLLLYSLGPDLTDDGAPIGPGRARLQDVAVRLER